MSRNKLPRTTSSVPRSPFFKPQGVCLKQLEIVSLQDDEFEAIKLHDFDQLSQIEAALAMKISQPTFGRILHSAYKKISQALLEGKAIAIQPQKGRAHETSQSQKYFDYTSAVCDVCGRTCLAK